MRGGFLMKEWQLGLAVTLLVAAVFAPIISREASRSKTDGVAIQPGKYPTVTNASGKPVRLDPPPGASIWCDTDGHFTPVLSNQYHPAYQGVYTTRQAAVDRAWFIWGDVNARPHPAAVENAWESYKWNECAPTNAIIFGTNRIDWSKLYTLLTLRTNGTPSEPFLILSNRLQLVFGYSLRILRVTDDEWAVLTNAYPTNVVEETFRFER